MAYADGNLKLRRYKLSKGGGWMIHVKTGIPASMFSKFVTSHDCAKGTRET
jgi:hypothetical protein